MMRFLRLIPLLLPAWLYMPAVQLPFFWDDVIHLRYVSGVSTEHLLTRAEIVSYYRPLVNLILQIPFLLDQHPSASLWHLILVLNHVLNVALVGALAQQLRLRGLVQFWAMTIFAVYPFSFQAVVWVLAWFHPLVVTLILLASITGLRAMRHPQNRWMAWVFGAVAPFVHENGVLTAPLLALLMLYAIPRKDWRRAFLIVLPIVVGAALYGLIALRLGVGAGEKNTLADVRFNIAYLVQGAVYPSQWLVQRVWLGGILFLGTAVLVLRRDWLRWRVVTLGLAWFALTGLPVILLLQESYVTSAPRLLYLGSVGIALMFGTLADSLVKFGQPNRSFDPPLDLPPLAGGEKKPLSAGGEGLGRGKSLGVRSLLATILMLIIVMLSASFVRGRLTLHLQLGAGYHELNEAVIIQDQAVRTLVINAPMWLDTEDSQFPISKNGAIFIPDYYGLYDFVWANTGINLQQIDAAFYYPTVDVWPGHVSGLKGTQAIDAGTMQGFIRQHDVIYAFTVRDADRFTARIIGQRATANDDFLAEFAPGVRLVDLQNQFGDEGQIQVALTWQRITDAPVLERPFLHLICDEQIVDQVDAHPIGNMYHFNAWQVGESWTEYRYLEAGSASDACLRLRLGLYNEESGQRATVTDADAHPQNEEFLILPLE